MPDDTLGYVGAVAGGLLLSLTAVLLVAPVGLRRWLGLFFGTAALLWGLLASGPPGLRFVIALGGWLGFLRTVGLARDRRRWPLGVRLSSAVLVHDPREAEQTAPWLDGGALVRMLGFGVIATAALFGVHHADDLEGSARWIARWGAGGVACYALADALAGLAMLGAGAMGHRVAPVHRDPLLGRTVTEFWTRWNRGIHDWLQRHIFRPVARRLGVAAGIAAAFVFSAALHAWLAGIALGWALGALMGSFFLVQGMLVAIERVVRMQRRPAALTRVWTIGTLLLTSPLFVEPMLRVFGL